MIYTLDYDRKWSNFLTAPKSPEVNADSVRSNAYSREKKRFFSFSTYVIRMGEKMGRDLYAEARRKYKLFRMYFGFSNYNHIGNHSTNES